MLIRLVLTEVQRFKNVKINKEMTDYVWQSGRPGWKYISLEILTFSNGSVSCLLLALLTPNLGFCKAWSTLYDYVDQ